MRPPATALLAIGVALAAAPARRAAAMAVPSQAGMYVTPPAATSVASAALVALAVVDSRVEVAMRGPIAQVVIHQRFRNDSDRATEATYVFPLPADAAVTAMAITTGNREVHAAIANRGDAQRRYEDAVSAGAAAALLEQERPDIFTQTVSAIAPHATIDVTLRYDTVAHPRGDGDWELTLPLAIAPRLVTGTASGRPTTGAGTAPDTDRAPDASRVTPPSAPGAGGPTDVAIQFADAVDAVTSPTHALAARGDGYELRDSHSERDVVIRWHDRQGNRGWVEDDGEHSVAAVVVTAPPAAPRAASAAAISVELVVDRSGLAAGEADATAQPIARELLAALRASDRVALADAHRRAPADAWRELENTWPSTRNAAIELDLARALQALHPVGPVILITPGLVADDAAVIAAAGALAVPVHVVAVGPAPNRSLLAAIAHATGGTVRFAAPGDDPRALARDLAADLASPPAPLTVHWGVLAATDVVPAELPRLGAGQSQLVLAHVAVAAGGRVHASNARARGEVFAIAVATPPAAVTGALDARGPLARRWARERLGELLAVATPPATVAAFALRNELVSPYTAMIAVSDDIVVAGGVKHTTAVPVSLPEGMRWQPVERELREQQARDHERKKAEAAKPVTPPTPTPTPPPTTVTTSADAAGANQPVAPPASPTVPAPDQAPSPNSAPPPANGKLSDDYTTREYAAGTARDVALVAGESTYATSYPRARRLALALGGGLVFEHPSSLATLTGELAVGGEFPVGVEASLWLVDATHVVERTLLDLELPLWPMQYRRATLAIGAGAQFGLGTGVAGALTLRLPFAPRHHLELYLRYDDAELWQGGHARGENAATIGIRREW